MFYVKSLTLLSILYVVSAGFLHNLPSGSFLQNAKINYHKQHICIFRVGNQKCFDVDKPEDKRDIMKLFDIYKELDTGAPL